jgi:hypothetical protein
MSCDWSTFGEVIIIKDGTKVLVAESTSHMTGKRLERVEKNEKEKVDQRDGDVKSKRSEKGCYSIFVINFGGGTATRHHLGGAGGNTNS